MPREEKREEITAESHLGPHFGSDADILVSGKYDNTILSNIHEVEPACMAYFLRKKKDKGGRYWRALISDMLKLKRSVNGWNVNKINQFMGATKGAPSVGDLQKQPNVLARNITDRDWEKKAKEEGRTTVK